MSGEVLIYVVMGAGLIAYVLTAGADFGGGVWDLLARGPRRDEMRSAIEHAIAPIWEVNHVWLIFVIVMMFTVFPDAYAAIGVALHVPIALALIGIVLRGAAFSFRAYGLQPSHVRERWGRVFAWSSLVSPVFLGMTLAALSTGAIRVEDGAVTSSLLAGWTTPFAVLVGAFALVLFAMLAAVYLTIDTDGALQEDFRRRALISEAIAGLLAGLVFLRARADAPLLFQHLAASTWTVAVQVATAGAAGATIATLALRRYRLARVFVGAQVSLVVLGWGLAMDAHLILPDVSIHAAGARPEVLGPLMPVLAVGALLLGPSLYALLKLFKSRS